MTNLEKLEKIFAEYKDDLEPGTLTEDTSFEELNFDSLDVVDLIMSLEEEFDCEIPDEEVDNIKTVGDIVKYIEAHI